MSHSTSEYNPKSILTLILLFLFTFLFHPHSISAEDGFTTTQTIKYQIDNLGNASVTHQFQLINNFSTIYAKEYQLTIPQKSVDKLLATDNSGNIVKNVQNQNDKTIINLVFNQPKLGKDATTDFQVSYFLPKLATPKGKTWEVFLPQPPPSQETTLNLDLPTIFGTLSFASIKPVMQSVNGNTQHLTFQLSDNTNKIGLAFGQSQLFNLNLSYFLENATNQIVTKEVPLPPDTDSQTVIYQKIDPLPQNINIDQDGNWLATYLLNPNQKINIKASGQVKIINNKNIPVSIDSVSYLKSTTYWPVSDPIIAAIAAKLSHANSIYDFVVQTLTYDYNRLGQSQRRGALAALEQPQQSLCTDFTDLFITIARAKGIPAREIQGFAYSNNSKIKPINTTADVLHAWPQFYDKTSQSWKSIDPTWGKTTNGVDFFHDLDLNHITFVIHGQSDQYPPPPGSFRSSNSAKTVNVDFADQESMPNYQSLRLKIINANLKQTEAEIFNPNLFSVKNIDLSIPGKNWQKNLLTMAPLSTTKIQLPALLLQNKITLLAKDDYQSNYQISSINKMYYLYRSIFIGCLIIFLSACGIIITSHR